MALIHKNINRTRYTVRDKSTLHQSCVNAKGPIKEDVGKMTPVLSLNYTIKLQSWQKASSSGRDPCFRIPGSAIKWRSMVTLQLRTIWRWGKNYISNILTAQAEWRAASSTWLEEATAGWRELTCGDSLPPEGKRCPGLDGVCRNWTVIIGTRPPGQRGCGITDFFYMDAGGRPRGTWQTAQPGRKT